MKIKALLCVSFCCSLLFLFVPIISAQNSTNYFYNSKYYESDLLFEVGASIGAINCLTDLGGTKGSGGKFIKDINLQNTKICGGGYVALEYREMFGIRIEATVGQVTAYDSILKPVAAASVGRYQRNLSFRSHIAELVMLGELYPMALFGFSDGTVPKASPYLLAGIGLFNFNPQAYLNGNWIDLQPLHLEGQGFREYANRPNYSLTGVCYPVGIGVRYEISNFFVVRAELVHRFTNTDYLDDVSQEAYVNPDLFSRYLSAANAKLARQLYDRHKELNPAFADYPGNIRGRSSNNDTYFSFNLKLALTLGRKKR